MVTIEALTKAPYNVPAERQIKTLVYIADSKPVLILIARRRSVERSQTCRRARHRERFARPRRKRFSPRSARIPAASARSVSRSIPVYADERLRDAADMTTGANEDGFHFRHVAIERDIQVTQWSDLRLVQAGEPCAKCGKPLKIRRAIEVGHVFKLGTKYSEKLNALFLDEAGKQQTGDHGLLRHRRHPHLAGGHRADATTRTASSGPSASRPTPSASRR